MKRLRTLCAVVGAAILCTTVTLATEYEVPPYTLEGAEKRSLTERGRSGSEAYARSRTHHKFPTTSLW
jgi:hypothetical protein